MLRRLTPSTSPSLLMGTDPADDAAVFRVRDDLALVQTVDFFTPIVDDPYTFGQIAAANSLSDVYAVGGTPLTALNIVGFPVDQLGRDVLGDILRGGADKVREAGAAIVGGHTIDDAEPKYGLAVTGIVHPDRVVRPDGARPGDVLVLTKPIGTGAVATSLKAGEAVSSHVNQAVRWMTLLNASASAAMVAVDSHAATDVTGFGLVGHLVDLCRASGVSAVVDAAAVPLLPGALAAIERGFVPRGTRANRAYSDDADVEWHVQNDAVVLALCDPQTSGGLLISMDPNSYPRFATEIKPDALAAVVGKMTEVSRSPTVAVMEYLH